MKSDKSTPNNFIDNRDFTIGFISCGEFSLSKLIFYDQ